MNCTNCGAQIPEGAQFCTGCGAPAQPAYQQPVYQMNTDDMPVRAVGFGEAVGNFFKQYAKFSGRATRREYWFAVLFLAIIGAAAGVIDGLIFGGETTPLTSIVSLATFIPQLAVTWRRLHDSGKSGLWWLLNLTGIGSIVVLIFMCLKSDRDNQYGPRKVEGVL